LRKRHQKKHKNYCSRVYALTALQSCRLVRRSRL
jgi:hypothetical protein